MEIAGKFVDMHLKHLVIKGVLFAGTVFIALCAYMWATQRDQIFQPTHILSSTPNRIGLNYLELHIPSGQGKEKGMLDAWWVPATHGDIAPTLYYLHGNDKNISSNLSHLRRLHDLGYNVFLLDYRGYGKSTDSEPSESKVYEDAESGWQYLIKQGAIKPNQVVIYGHSLGGAIAIELASHHPEASGLVVESTFTSMLAMGQLRFPYLPVAWLLNQKFDSLSKIVSLKIPVLFIHGTWDEEVPAYMSQQLYAVAPKPKYITLIEGGSHGNSGAIAWVEYRDALNDFVQKYVKP